MDLTSQLKDGDCQVDFKILAISYSPEAYLNQKDIEKMNIKGRKNIFWKNTEN